MTYNAILKTIPVTMSAKLAARNLRKKKKINLIKQGTENIVGTALIKETANFLDF